MCAATHSLIRCYRQPNGRATQNPNCGLLGVSGDVLVKRAGLIEELVVLCVCRRASDSSSGWLDDQYSSVSSRHQLSWSSRHHQHSVDLSPQPRHPPHTVALLDDVAAAAAAPSLRQWDTNRHHGCGRHLGLTPSRQPPQPSSLSALVECVITDCTFSVASLTESFHVFLENKDNVTLRNRSAIIIR